MFSFVLLLCLIHLSVSDVISGRVVLKDNPERSMDLPPNCRLEILVFDKPLINPSVHTLGHSIYTNITFLPTSYQVVYKPLDPPTPPPGRDPIYLLFPVKSLPPPLLTYFLWTKIIDAKNILYTGEHQISMPISYTGSSSLDILVSKFSVMESG